MPRDVPSALHWNGRIRPTSAGIKQVPYLETISHSDPYPATLSVTFGVFFPCLYQWNTQTDWSPEYVRD